MTRCFASFFAALFLLSACNGLSDTAPAPAENLPTQRRAQVPITKVVQTLNLPYHQTWSEALSILKKRRIPIEQTNNSSGEIVTKWVDILDTPCGVHPRSNAPLSCQVRYVIQIGGVTKVASSFSIRYTQNCKSLHGRPLECPNSNAEKLMLEIVNDLKLAGGVL